MLNTILSVQKHNTKTSLVKDEDGFVFILHECDGISTEKETPCSLEDALDRFHQIVDSP